MNCFFIPFLSHLQNLQMNKFQARVQATLKKAVRPQPTPAQLAKRRDKLIARANYQLYKKNGWDYNRVKTQKRGPYSYASDEN